jgi:hypothetical protein
MVPPHQDARPADQHARRLPQNFKRLLREEAAWPFLDGTAVLALTETVLVCDACTTAGGAGRLRWRKDRLRLRRRFRRRYKSSDV